MLVSSLNESQDEPEVLGLIAGDDFGELRVETVLKESSAWNPLPRSFSMSAVKGGDNITQRDKPSLSPVPVILLTTKSLDMSHVAKQGDDLTAPTTRLAIALPDPYVAEEPRKITSEERETKAYRTLRDARSRARYEGARKLRQQKKEEEEAAKKK
ncbi:hypothetical protein M422DRAFT_67130 [Sphaerobolus stellatus SS14]|uniref:Unplaced genomic scaffold SPHSTscaffold_36, whole genome shotgun sequence n=1 Tax=Sphaerobolus stellatus (strain SS14) TaxID=990650 RepID=A0A0C9W261_SPHS4|nr:hypothetical protein M422DRAFT_67130 [Sphaerobolus stellatus SS14]